MKFDVYDVEEKKGGKKRLFLTSLFSSKFKKKEVFKKKAMSVRMCSIILNRIVGSTWNFDHIFIGFRKEPFLNFRPIRLDLGCLGAKFLKIVRFGPELKWVIWYTDRLQILCWFLIYAYYYGYEWFSLNKLGLCVHKWRFYRNNSRKTVKELSNQLEILTRLI